MRENIERGLGLHASARVLLALVEEGGLSPRGRLRASSSARAARRRRAARRCATCWPPIPAVAQRLSLAQLDACFDDAPFLRHVPEVIARLDAARRPPVAAPTAARHDGARCWLTSFLRSGKVRDLYALDDGRLLLVASDRISRLRRRAADADPGQGPGPDRPVALLVRARRRAIVPNHLLARLATCRTASAATADGRCAAGS